jgi:hypothetical protein
MRILFCYVVEKYDAGENAAVGNGEKHSVA